MTTLRRVLSCVCLCIVCSLLCIESVEEDGCHTRKNGCCIRCNPGFLLYQKCGQCKPCPRNGYMATPNASPTCRPCQKCEGIFKYKSNCSATENAKCTCIPGKKCANEECTQCEDNPCPAGTQLNGQGCMQCPHGTFNPGTEVACQPWKNCSDLEAIHVTGTSESDVVCLPKKIQNPTMIPSPSSPFTTTQPEEVPAYGLNVVIGVTSVIAIIIVCMGIFVCLTIRLEKIKNKFKKVKQIEQEDACSCHYPEEEHGGEEETLSTEP